MTMDVEAFVANGLAFADKYKDKRVRVISNDFIDQELHNAKGIVIGASSTGSGAIMVKLDDLDRPRVFTYDELELLDPLPLPG